MNLEFRCHRCGACCNSGPTLTVEEAYTYSKDFLVQLTLYLQTYSMPEAKMKTMRDKTWEMGGLTIGLPGKTEVLGLFMLVPWYSDDHCSMLEEDGSCKLHKEGRVPLTCRSVPLCPGLEVRSVRNATALFESCGCVRETKKMGTPGWDLFIRNGKFNEASPLVQNMTKEWEAMKKDVAIMRKVRDLTEAVQDGQGRIEEGIRFMIREGMSSYYLPLPITYLLDPLRQKTEERSELYPDSWLGDEKEVIEFVKNQGNLYLKLYPDMVPAERLLYADLLITSLHVLHTLDEDINNLELEVMSLTQNCQL